VHRIRAEDPDATAAAAAYERELRDSFGLSPGAKPRFDLILLGMGADGHTGSLFPGGRAVEERERLVVAECVEALEAWRITLTLPVLNAARRVVFLVTGEEKAATLAAVLSPRTGRDHPPAARVRPAQGSLVWLVDAAAARLLESTKITDSSGRQPGETRIEEARM
jgi:6-phosphogluconolactonase